MAVCAIAAVIVRDDLRGGAGHTVESRQQRHLVHPHGDDACRRRGYGPSADHRRLHQYHEYNPCRCADTDTAPPFRARAALPAHHRHRVRVASRPQYVSYGASDPLRAAGTDCGPGGRMCGARHRHRVRDKVRLHHHAGARVSPRPSARRRAHLSPRPRYG